MGTKGIANSGSQGSGYKEQNFADNKTENFNWDELHYYREAAQNILGRPVKAGQCEPFSCMLHDRSTLGDVTAVDGQNCNTKKYLFIGKFGMFIGASISLTLCINQLFARVRIPGLDQIIYTAEMMLVSDDGLGKPVFTNYGDTDIAFSYLEMGNGTGVDKAICATFVGYRITL